MRLSKRIISVECSLVILTEHLSALPLFCVPSFFLLCCFPLQSFRPAFFFLKKAWMGSKSACNHYFHRSSLSITKTRGLISRSNADAPHSLPDAAACNPLPPAPDLSCTLTCCLVVLRLGILARNWVCLQRYIVSCNHYRAEYISSTGGVFSFANYPVKLSL
jgi:hypothetical protein